MTKEEGSIYIQTVAEYGDGKLFIRHYRQHFTDQPFIDEYVVLYASDGEVSGRYSDGSDCTFSTLAEAENYLSKRTAELSA